MTKLSKTILIAVVCLFALRGLSLFSLELYYYNTLPSAPNENLDYVCRMTVMHFVRYGSAHDLHVVDSFRETQPIIGMLFVWAVLVGVIFGDLRIRRTEKATPLISAGDISKP
jgi:hypothetical protein